jgi:hypothetical protein
VPCLIAQSWYAGRFQNWATTEDAEPSEVVIRRQRETMELADLG